MKMSIVVFSKRDSCKNVSPLADWFRYSPFQSGIFTPVNGTPTKRQVSKRQVSKRQVSKRPVSKRLKRQVYKMSGLLNVRFTKC
jgi:hypothetical protein